MKLIIVILVLIDKKLSSNMDQISEHLNSSNQKVHSYDKTIKMIFNLGSKIGKKRQLLT